MKNLHERAVEAAIRFVERKGYEVLDRNWSCEGVAGRLDLVAMDEDAIVFIDVTAANREEGGFSEGNLTREQFELLAATWLEGYTPEHGGAAAGGSSPSLLPTRRGTSAARDPPSRSRAARTPAPLPPRVSGALVPAPQCRLALPPGKPAERCRIAHGAACPMPPPKGHAPLGIPCASSEPDGLAALRRRGAVAREGPGCAAHTTSPQNPGKGPAETGFGGDGGFRLREAGSTGAAARGSASKRMQAGLASGQGRIGRKEGNDAA